MKRISSFNYYDGGQLAPGGQWTGSLSVSLVGGGSTTGNTLFMFKGIGSEAAIEKVRKLVEFLEGEGQ